MEKVASNVLYKNERSLCCSKVQARIYSMFRQHCINNVSIVQYSTGPVNFSPHKSVWGKTGFMQQEVVSVWKFTVENVGRWFLGEIPVFCSVVFSFCSLNHYSSLHRSLYKMFFLLKESIMSLLSKLLKAYWKCIVMSIKCISFRT